MSISVAANKSIPFCIHKKISETFPWNRWISLHIAPLYRFYCFIFPFERTNLLILRTVQLFSTNFVFTIVLNFILKCDSVVLLNCMNMNNTRKRLVIIVLLIVSNLFCAFVRMKAFYCCMLCFSWRKISVDQGSRSSN